MRILRGFLTFLVLAFLLTENSGLAHTQEASVPPDRAFWELYSFVKGLVQAPRWPRRGEVDSMQQAGGGYAKVDKIAQTWRKHKTEPAWESYSECFEQCLKAFELMKQARKYYTLAEQPEPGSRTMNREALRLNAQAGDIIRGLSRDCFKRIIPERRNRRPRWPLPDDPPPINPDDPTPRSANRYICQLRDLAALVFKRYGTWRPIGIVPLADRPHTYLVVLSGTEFALGQTTHILDDVAAFQGNPALTSAYIQNILSALRSMVPPHSRLVLAGHSLGGMVAQNLVTDRDFVGRYTVDRVITFGSPQTSPETSSVRYLRVEVQGDPVPRMGPPQYVFHPSLTVEGKGLDPIGNHLFYPDSLDLGKYDVAGHYVPDFSKPDAYDLSTQQKFQRECFGYNLNSFRDFKSP